MSEAYIQRLKAIVEVGPFTSQQRLNKSDPKAIILEEKTDGKEEYQPVMKAYPSVAYNRKEEGMIEIWTEVEMKESDSGTRCLVFVKSNKNRHLTTSNDIFVIFELVDDFSWGVFTRERIKNIGG